MPSVIAQPEMQQIDRGKTESKSVEQQPTSANDQKTAPEAQLANPAEGRLHAEARALELHSQIDTLNGSPASVVENINVKYTVKASNEPRKEQVNNFTMWDKDPKL